MNQPVTRVLICDDDEDIRKLLQKLLQSLNCQVIAICQDGNDGVKQFADTRPDLVLMDIRMPGKNGIDALREIIKLDSQAKVIMLSAMDDTVVAESSIHSGASGYIHKGLAVGELLEELDRTLQRLGFAGLNQA